MLLRISSTSCYPGKDRTSYGVTHARPCREPKILSARVALRHRSEDEGSNAKTTRGLLTYSSGWLPCADRRL